MIAFQINGTNQQHIADTYNDGVIPAYGVVDGAYTGEDNYFIVMDDGSTKIVGEDYWDTHQREDYEFIVIMKKD